MKKTLFLSCLFLLAGNLELVAQNGDVTLNLSSSILSETYTKAFQNDGKGHEYQLTAPPGIHTFKITGVPKHISSPFRTDWLINGIKKDTDNARIFDPSYSYGQNSGSYRVSAEIYDRDGNWTEAHHWNVTVTVINAEIDLTAYPAVAISGEDITFGYQVRNTGNQSHSFGIGATLQKKNSIGVWINKYDISGIPNEALSPDSQTPTQYHSYTIPSNAPEGEYRLRVAVYEEEPGSSEQLDREESPSFNIVAAEIDAEIDLTAYPIEALAGETLIFGYQVRNTGNQTHLFGVGATLQRRNLIGVWTDAYHISGIPNESVTPNSQTPTRYQSYTVPSDAPKGTYRIRVAVWDGSPGSSNQLDRDDSPSFNIVPVVINAEIDLISVTPKEGIAGEIITFKYWVENKGTIQYKFGIGATIQIKDGITWKDYKHIGDIPSETLNPNTQTSIRERNYLVPPDTPEGEYRVVVATWDGDPGSSNQLDRDESDNFTVEERKVAATIEISSIEPQIVVVGNNLSISYEIKNTGNLLHDFGIGHEIWRGSTKMATLDDRQEKIGPNSSFQQVINFTVPDDWVNGINYFVRIAVWEEMAGEGLQLDRDEKSFFIRVKSNANFVVKYKNFPSEVQTAFQHAVNIWATLLSSDVPINVSAKWVSLEGVLGYGISTDLLNANFEGAPISNTFYPIALAEKLSGKARNSSNEADIEVNINSNIPWYLGIDGNTPSGLYDLVSFVLHELAHGLGFMSSMSVKNGLGSWGFGPYPLIFDTFIENGTGQQLINQSIFPNSSTALASQLTSNDIFWSGPEAVSHNDNIRPKLYAPGAWQGGSSIDHLDQATYGSNNPNSLMTPGLYPGISTPDPGPIVLGMLNDIGWDETKATPAISVNPPSLSFGNVQVDTDSKPGSYILSGSKLTDNVNIAAPEGFQVSLSSGSGYNDNLSITPNDGSFNREIFVRFSPTQVRAYDGTITNTSSGITRNVSVSGTGTSVPIGNPFAGGDGSKNNPYKIVTAEQLDAVRNFLDAHFILINDIDLSFDTGNPSGQFWNDGKGWKPIGNSDNPFMGSFDGNGFTITGLTINRPDQDFIGLFGSLGSDAEINNLGVGDIKIIGHNKVGGLVGWNTGEIVNSHAVGSISGDNTVGGLVGQSDGTIIKSYFTGNIHGRDSYVGGLVGWNLFGIVTSSYALFNVNVDTEGKVVGGLVGRNDGTITNSYVVSNVNGNDGVGALAGENWESIFGSYWNTEISGQHKGVDTGDTTGVFGLKTIQMLQQSSFIGWDFEDTWTMIENETYPWLQENLQNPKPAPLFLSIPENDTLVELPVVLKWQEYAGTESYQLQVAPNQSFETIVVDSSGIETLSVEIIKDIQEGTTYYWHVRAGGAPWSWSEVWSFTTEVDNLTAPTGISIQTLTDSLELSWHQNLENNISGYVIYQGHNPDDLDSVKTVSSEITSYQTSVDETTFFAVKALNGTGVTSPFSKVVSYIYNTTEITSQWQLISNSAKQEENIDESIQLFGFEGSYQVEDTLTGLKGYWIKSNQNNTVQFRGAGLDSASVELSRGWNLIGSLSAPVQVGDINDPGEILTNTPVYRYDTDSTSYDEAEELIPQQGYWIFADGNGSIELDIGDPEEAQNQEKSVHDTEAILELDRILFSSNGTEQQIFFAQNNLSQEERLSYLLPPKPPEPILDVRTSEGYKLVDTESAKLDLTARSYPISIKLQKNLTNDMVYQLELKDGDDQILLNLIPNVSQVINKEYDNIYLKRLSKDEAILEYNLLPNYPNPFNPSTTIKYKLANKSHVNLVIYDILGRRIQTLVNKQQQPGIYTVQFDGSRLASGMYFIRIKADEFVKVQPMTLIK